MLDAFVSKKHLEEDEHVQMIVHKHWALGVRALILPTVMILCAQLYLAIGHTRAGLVIALGWSLLSVLWWARNFLDYYLDAWIITDHGIIAIEWLGWFHRQSSRILYSDVQGVSTETHGISGMMLRYGSVAIEKISTGAAVSIDNVPRPRRVESTILKNMESYLHSKNMKNAKHVEELLSQFVAQHVQKDGIKKPAVEKSVPSRPTKNAFSSSKIGSPRE